MICSPVRALRTAVILFATAACAHVPQQRSQPAPVSLSHAVRTGNAPATTGDALIDYLRDRELMVPVDGVRVAQVPNTFDSSRGERAHNAHDIMAKRGTPVLSADDGHVIRLATSSLGGTTIYATDPSERLVYYYAHLDHYAAGIKAGSTLHKGEVIAYVGSTGNASANAPHLHFQVARLVDMSRHWEGVPVDARPWFALDGQRR